MDKKLIINRIKIKKGYVKMDDDFETLTSKVPTDLLNNFRTAAFRKYGPKRGYMQKCLAEAIILWLDHEKGE